MFFNPNHFIFGSYLSADNEGLLNKIAIDLAAVEVIMRAYLAAIKEHVKFENKYVTNDNFLMFIVNFECFGHSCSIAICKEGLKNTRAGLVS